MLTILFHWIFINITLWQLCHCSSIIIVIIIANVMLIAHLFGQIVVEARLPAPVAGQEALLYRECQLQILKQNLSYLGDFSSLVVKGHHGIYERGGLPLQISGPTSCWWACDMAVLKEAMVIHMHPINCRLCSSCTTDLCGTHHHCHNIYCTVNIIITVHHHHHHIPSWKEEYS